MTGAMKARPSVPEAILQFFAANPDARPTRGQLASQLGLPYWRVKEAVTTMRRRGVLRRYDKPQKLSDVIGEYFEANADEEMTYADISQKFGCTIEAARQAVYAAMDSGVIESVHVIRNRSKGIAKEAG